MRGRGAGNRVIKAGGGTPPSPTYTHTPQPTTPSALQEKAWIRKDGGEQRAFARRRCYLIVCVTGGAAVERMLWSFPPGAPPPPRLSPLSVRTHTRLFLLVFPVFSFHLLPTRPLLSSTFPSFLLSFLRRKASLSVFTADLDLNVHTIKARGECQEWGWLSTRRSARALRGRIHRAQSSSAELRAAASGEGGGGWGGRGSRARAGWAAPTEAFGVGRCVACEQTGA